MLGASVAFGAGIAVVAPAAVAGVFVGWAGIYIGYKRSVYKRMYDRADEGSFEEGRAYFEKMREKNKPGHLWRDFAIAQLAYYELREGEYEVAERAFAALLSDTEHDVWRAYAGATLAAIDGLRGVPDGQRRTLPAPSRATELWHAVVYAATGASDALDAVSVPRGFGSWLMGISVGHERRAVALLQAFVQHTSGETPDPERLDRARAAFVGEYDYLLPPFDGLGDFIDEHGLYAACLPAATLRARRS